MSDFGSSGSHLCTLIQMLLSKCWYPAQQEQVRETHQAPPNNTSTRCIALSDCSLMKELEEVTHALAMTARQHGHCSQRNSDLHGLHVFFKICYLSLCTPTPHGDNCLFPTSEVCWVAMHPLTSPGPQLQMLQGADSSGQADELFLNTIPQRLGVLFFFFLISFHGIYWLKWKRVAPSQSISNFSISCLGWSSTFPT